MRVLEYEVEPCDEGRQIKQVIRNRLGISHRQLSRLKVCDGMSVNGAVVHANHVLHAGDSIALRIEQEEAAPVPGELERAALDSIGGDERARVPSQAMTAAVCAAMDARYAEDIMRLSPSGRARTQAELAQEIVVYEDEDMLIIDKPAPLPTGASARQDGLTLESVLYARYGVQAGWQFRPVNRLDKGTSGLMAAAKTAHAHFGLQRQLHTPDFEREYLAITAGAPAPDCGTITLPIGREPGSLVKRRVCEDGRPCTTHYEVLSRAGDLVLIRLRLETGRTHQIRVHMSALGCPVLGDFLYGEEDARLPGRFALHSCRLRCVQPVTGAVIELEASLPRMLKAVLTRGAGD